MRRTLIYAPEAADDLDRTYDYIATRSGSARARGYVDRIRARCDRLIMFAELGHRRDDIRLGLRVVGFERSATIVFHLTIDMVVVDRILYGGRDLGAAFASEPD